MAISCCAALAAIGVGLFPGAGAARPEKIFSANNVKSSLSGRGEFSQDCEPFPGQRVVLVTVNTEYMEMLRNWLVYATPFLQETEHLHVIAEEEEVVPKLVALREKHDLDFTVSTPSKPQIALVVDPAGSEGFGNMMRIEDPFGSAGFGSMMRKRPDYIKNVLEKGCSVLFIDLDTVLLKDPFKDMQAAGKGDLYVTSNDPRLGGSRTEYCGCFLYMHPSDWTLKLMEDWGVATEGKLKNQGALNDKLRERGVQMGRSDKVIVLPMEMYPPGGVVTGRLGDDYKPDPHPTMYHANWLGGLDTKVDFLKHLNVWKPEYIKE